MRSPSMKIDLNDPIFKPRPGWGGKLKILIKNNSNFKNLGYLSLTLVAIFYLFITDRNQEPVSDNNEPDQIVLTALPGEGSTNLSRKALDIYLAEHNQLNLKPEQRLYAEDYLTKAYKPGIVLEGEEIKYSKEMIANIIGRSLELKDWQLANLSHLITLTRDPKNRE